jgi:hypothetical protein
MKQTLFALLFISGLSLPLFAEPASEASIREFLSLSGQAKSLDGIFDMMDGVIDRSIPADLAQKSTPEQKAAIERFKARSTEILKEEMSWAKLEPMFAEIYQGVFSQEEMDGLIAFHKSAVGQAYIKKMPALTKKSMEVMQKVMPAMMQKMQQLGKELGEELKPKP